MPLGEPEAAIAWNNPLRDRIVLMGGTFVDSREFFQTPHGLLAGVEVQANLVHMLATRRFIHSSGWAVGLGLQVAVCLLMGIALTVFAPLPGPSSALWEPCWSASLPVSLYSTRLDIG